VSAPSSFRFEIDRSTRVARITLDRPDRLNALTFEVYTELRDTLHAGGTRSRVEPSCSRDRGRRSAPEVTWRTSSALSSPAMPKGSVRSRMTCDLILNIRRCRRPVIAALSGTVAGAGAVIAAACDVRIASETAKIAFLFVRVGLSGADMGRRGSCRASWGSRATDPHDRRFRRRAPALEIGLYNAVVPVERVLDEATRSPRARARPRRGARGHEARARRRVGARPRAALTHEADVQAELMERPDFHPRRKAFRAARAQVPGMAFPIRSPSGPSSTTRRALAPVVGAFAAAARELPEPDDDGEARTRARTWLTRLGEGGWLDPIRRRDWRACCLTREALGAASPLADAVFALQGLSAVPLHFAENEAMRSRWLEEAVSGRAMGAFAMTESEAGSDAAAIATRARRDGSAYVLDGKKTFITNAAIADIYTVFATTVPRSEEGISCFIVPAETPGLTSRAQVLAAPHPLGEIAFEDAGPEANRLGPEDAVSRSGQDARPAPRHRGRRRLRHGPRASTRRSAMREPAGVWKAARRVPARAGQRADGDRSDGRPARLSRRVRG
jgi:alkylation response protein AidB-like acyl-CoA dehydrogenase